MYKQILLIGTILLTTFACTEKKADAQEETELQSVSGEVKYSVPVEWKSEIPKSKMRKAQYKIPGFEGRADAEMAVFVFPGTGGSVQANIDRWMGQFIQPDGSDTKDKAEITKVKINNFSVTKMYVTGTHLKSKSPMMMSGPKEELSNYAMLAAIVETSKDPWFFKMVGPQKTIDHWRPEFDKFVQTFK